MKTTVTALLISIMLSGCASIQTLIPSFWDNNQSQKIIDVRVSVQNLNCEQPRLPQLEHIRTELTWFQLYSEAKGPRQQDVLKIIAPIQETLQDFIKREQQAAGSVTYCKLKRQIMDQQAQRAAKAILGRF